MTKTPRVYLAAVAVLLNLTPLSAQIAARESDTDMRTRAIVAAFTKSKHKVKERGGMRMEKYKVVRSEPLIRANPESLSGTYEVDDLGFALRLRIDRNGRVSGSGSDRIGESVARTFTVSNGVLRGALLTATKVFASGRSEKLEGVFMKRTSYESPTDSGFSQIGLGVIGGPVQLHGLTLDRFFYRLKQ